ncbi:enoyl-CoA hydratase/isomerase family protein [Shewanella sp. MF05960]|uniref:enoyl-CoA hydratase/isomerase family protein n=1 Tax=Shewanella sp. MF05960 TaxID=3434874 RepID=UPI003D7B2489
MNRRDVLKATALTAMGAAAALTNGSVLAQSVSEKDHNRVFKNIVMSREKGILILRINKLPRNEVSQITLHELNMGLDMAAEDKSVGAIVITGSESVFSAGAGADVFQEQTQGMPTHASLAHQVFSRIEGFPKPVIAAINGYSGGGGNELAFACDIRIATKSATFRQPELQVGLIPGFGGMQRLQRHIGLGRAMEMMISGRLMDANEALSFGLVTTVVADNEVLTAAISMAEKLIKDVNGPAFAAFKERMGASYSEPFGAALKNDQLAFDRLVVTEEAHSALQRFIAKQKG